MFDFKEKKRQKQIWPNSYSGDLNNTEGIAIFANEWMNEWNIYSRKLQELLL